MTPRFEKTASTRKDDSQTTPADSAYSAHEVRSCLPASDTSLWTADIPALSSASGSRLSTVSYLPDKYEPRYAYPLIVWFHSRGSSEQQLHDVMPIISTQNFLGLAVRGPLPVVGRFSRRREAACFSERSTPPQRCSQDPPAAAGPFSTGFGWSKSQQAVGKLLEDVEEAVCRFGREYNVHTERIYLAGFDEGGTTALHLMLSQPDWFAGAISLCGRFPRMDRPLARFPNTCGNRALLVTGRKSRKVTPADVAGTARLLHAAGIRVRTEQLDASHELTPDMLRQINPWIIADVSHPVF